MRYYRLLLGDQPKPSFALTLPGEKPPARRKAALIAPIHRFLGHFSYQSRAVKPEYKSVTCEHCGRYDEDDIFRIGFFDPFFINVKGDYDVTKDRITIISDRFLAVLQKEKVRGYKTSQLGKTGWHAICAIERVKSLPKVIRVVGSKCSKCGRYKEASGGFVRQHELEVPSSPKTIFTTKDSWPSTFMDRTLFMTEDVVLALKAGGVKGEGCRRLLTEEDLLKEAELAKKGKRLKPTEIAILF